ncbi:MAG: calcium-translocating P-type ATPase, PMCA-type [Clostridiales bacterium]|nr:calcium-translocating P-type ATPase, PMCA-type [Clostridiales bacterium]
MTFHDLTVQAVLTKLNVDKNTGLTETGVKKSCEKYGNNTLSKGKKRGFFRRVVDALKEPMLIILCFGFMIAFGTGLGKYFKTGEMDFAESFGILFAVLLSVFITIIMEGSSERAFETLSKLYQNVSVKVLRNGKITSISQNSVVVGDVIIIESGDKIIADGRLIESNFLSIDESALTGESNAVDKDAFATLKNTTPLAERVNSVYSGTFVTAGNGKMVVTAIGNKTEMGNIAGELGEKSLQSPLQNKLFKLGKIITTIGAITATVVFILSAVKLALIGGFNFSNIQELFIASIVLIIAAVPEGLPTIVAVSLALNMIKLAKENALIKKMTATETAGAVSVICSDKTGTLTQNKMTVLSVCKNEFCIAPDKLSEQALLQNFVCNSTADLICKNKSEKASGSATEVALLHAYAKSNKTLPYAEFRDKFPIVSREPFSSDKKYMSTTISIGGKLRKLVKGAPEHILPLCNLTSAQIRKITNDVRESQKKARRVLCFAHVDFEQTEDREKLFYDGFVAIADPIRKEVYKAVSDCKRAGIKIKILTGDNIETALSIARELKVVESDYQAINASDLEKLDDDEFKKALKNVTVIARSTPIVKLRVVKALKSMGEVVAVTGDGINDAPAIKHADVGIAMGVAGSEIAKESADVVLLDDSFATVVKAVSFGRNVYRNLQRFILFQLSVNLSALLFVTVCAILGLRAPFNTLQLLWINVIMDGPPALTLGLERASDKLMDLKPVKKSTGIVSAKMLVRIIFNGVFVAVVMLMQYLTNFLKVGEREGAGALFTLFITFQLMNAFNSRELGAESIFNGIGKNKIMVLTFLCVLIVHVIVVQFFPFVFAVRPLSLWCYIKIFLTSFSIVGVSEIYKAVYRLLKNGNINRGFWQKERFLKFKTRRVDK